MTKLLTANSKAIAEAAQILRAGGLVAFPTETVYGLAADAGQDAAVQRIFAAKGRPDSHPLIVHVARPEDATVFARDVPAFAQRLMHAFWPGPLTLIVPAPSTQAPEVTGGTSTVAVRVPDHAATRALCDACGWPLTATSANLCNDGKDDIFRGDSWLEGSFDVDRHSLWAN